MNDIIIAFLKKPIWQKIVLLLIFAFAFGVGSGIIKALFQ